MSGNAVFGFTVGLSCSISETFAIKSQSCLNSLQSFDVMALMGLPKFL